MFEPYEETKQPWIRFIDLFCGIGGFRYGLEQAAKKAKLSVQSVFSSDIDEACQSAYAANFGERPVGDITKVDAAFIPDHDLLLAGFPCQPFSIIGNKRRFGNTQDNIFYP